MAEKSNWQNTGSFANVRLSDEEMSNYDAWVRKSAPDVTEALALLLAEGYKLSLAVVGETGGVRCTLTQPERKHRNYDLILSSFGNNAEDAILLSIYKTNVMYPSERLPESRGTGRRG